MYVCMHVCMYINYSHSCLVSVTLSIFPLGICQVRQWPRRGMYFVHMKAHRRLVLFKF